MGDRTTCTLEPKGKITRKQLDLLIEAIAKDGFYDTAKAIDTLFDEFQAYGCFTFAEVNYGEVPSDIEQCILDHNITCIWSHDGGGGYGPEVVVFWVGDDDVFANETFTTSQGEIVLTFDDLKNDEFMASARRANDFMVGPGCTIVGDPLEALTEVRGWYAEAPIKEIEAVEKAIGSNFPLKLIDDAIKALS